MPSYVQTVLGPVASDQLGVTMMHEHLLADATVLYEEPSTASDKFMSRQPITIETLNWLRYHYTNHLDNLQQGDVDVAIDEAMMFKGEGGGAIVDCSVTGMSPDPEGLAKISIATGLHVVAATGFYIQPSHPATVSAMSEEELAAFMVKEMTQGMKGTSVKAGIIGEIGCSWPLHPDERKVVAAAAMASRRTGTAISIHPGRNEAAPMEIMDVLQRGGVGVDRIIMGHLERTIFDRARLKELAETGCYLEYDLFGQDISYYPIAPHIARPSDAQRIETIEWLVSEGHVDQIVVAHDAGAKANLTKWGGHGYGHILRVVVPWMRRRGMEEWQIEAILVHNPQRALSITTGQ